MSLTFVFGSSYHHAPFCGVSITDDLGAFVALRRWEDKELYVLDVKLFAAATGRWLKRCPYARDFQKHFTIYEEDLDFQTALRDFCQAHHVKRLGYNPADFTLPAPVSPVTATGARVLMPVPVDAELLAKARATLKQISPLRDKRDAKAVLAYFLAAHDEQAAPVLAVLYAIAAVDTTTAVEIAYAEQQAQARATAIDAEIAACEQLPGDTVCMQVGGYEGTRWVPKDTAIVMIRHNGVRVARSQNGRAE